MPAELSRCEGQRQILTSSSLGWLLACSRDSAPQAEIADSSLTRLAPNAAGRTANLRTSLHWTLNIRRRGQWTPPLRVYFPPPVATPRRSSRSSNTYTPQRCCSPGYDPSATPTAASSPPLLAASPRERNSLCRLALRPRMQPSRLRPRLHAEMLALSKCKHTSPGHPVCAT